MPQTTPIPRFILYEETPQDVELDFLHVETIYRRSSLHDWTIRAHSHPDQHQILLLTEGAGMVRLEDNEYALEPTAIVTVPALTVHSYRFQPGSNGFVLTVAAPFLEAVLGEDRHLAAAFSKHGQSLARVSREASPIEAFEALEREFVWSFPGRRSAIKAYLQLILVRTARLNVTTPELEPKQRRDAELVGRFRAMVEQRFREQPGLDAMAGALGVTTAKLNAACRAITGRSSAALVHDRLIVEAKRHLLYTGMTVAEIASALGFSDPAYFNRFFSRRTNTSPGLFRSMANRLDGQT